MMHIPGLLIATFMVLHSTDSHAGPPRWKPIPRFSTDCWTIWGIVILWVLMTLVNWAVMRALNEL
ncbi:MAG: hypothetical protein DWH91_08030 [Planctomycetota bacterium]|nr:MAG: hypothetical protein DWH91_08030 [Planctomycetota bacterium]